MPKAKPRSRSLLIGLRRINNRVIQANNHHSTDILLISNIPAHNIHHNNSNIPNNSTSSILNRISNGDLLRTNGDPLSSSNSNGGHHLLNSSYLRRLFPMLASLIHPSRNPNFKHLLSPRIALNLRSLRHHRMSPLHMVKKSTGSLPLTLVRQYLTISSMKLATMAGAITKNKCIPILQQIPFIMTIA